MLVQGKEETTAKNNFSLNRFEALMDLTNTSYNQLNTLIEYDVKAMVHDKQRAPMKNVVSKCCEYMNIIDGYEYCFMIVNDFKISENIKPPLKKDIIKLKTNEIENSLRIDILKKRMKEPSCKWSLKSLSTIFESPSRYISLSTIKNIKKFNKYEASTLCYALQLDPQLLFSDHFLITRKRHIFENQTYSINKKFKNLFLNSDTLKVANIPKWFIEENENFSKKTIMLMINSYNKISKSDIIFDEVTNNDTINVSSLKNIMMSNSLKEERDYKDFVPSEDNKYKKNLTYNKPKTTAKDIYHLIDRLSVEEMGKLEKYIELRKQLLNMKYGNDNI